MCVLTETYRATWIPSLATTYTLQVTFDEQLKGPSQLVQVAEAPVGSTEKQAEQEMKLLKFVTRNSRGLRIRSHPTLQSVQVNTFLFSLQNAFLEHKYIFGCDRNKMLLIQNN